MYWCFATSKHLQEVNTSTLSLCAISLVNPFNAVRLLSAKAQGCKNLWKPSKPYHVGIHWIALIECSQMSTHLLGFQSFSRFLHHFVLAKLVTSSIMVKQLCCWWLIWQVQNGEKSLKKHWNPGKRILIWERTVRELTNEYQQDRVLMIFKNHEQNLSIWNLLEETLACLVRGHSLSQLGVWVSNHKKHTPQDNEKYLCEKFLKRYISWLWLNYSHLNIIPMTFYKDIIPYYNSYM